MLFFVDNDVFAVICYCFLSLKIEKEEYVGYGYLPPLKVIIMHPHVRSLLVKQHAHMEVPVTRRVALRLC